MKILKFEADWCGPCKAIAVPLRQAAEEAGVPVEYVDADTSPLAQQYRVMSMPTLILVDEEGSELRRVSGLQNKPRIAEFIRG